MPRSIYEMSTSERLSRGIASPGQMLFVMVWTLAKFVCAPIAGVTLGWLLACELFGLTISPLWVLDRVLFALTR